MWFGPPIDDGSLPFGFAGPSGERAARPSWSWSIPPRREEAQAPPSSAGLFLHLLRSQGGNGSDCRLVLPTNKNKAAGWRKQPHAILGDAAPPTYLSEVEPTTGRTFFYFKIVRQSSLPALEFNFTFLLLSARQAPPISGIYPRCRCSSSPPATGSGRPSLFLICPTIAIAAVPAGRRCGWFLDLHYLIRTAPPPPPSAGDGERPRQVPGGRHWQRQLGKRRLPPHRLQHRQAALLLWYCTYILRILSVTLSQLLQ